MSVNRYPQNPTYSHIKVHGLLYTDCYVNDVGKEK